MSDLTEYDRVIVEAAEALVGGWYRSGLYNFEPVQKTLVEAVKAKQEAQRPKCNWASCWNPAVQRVQLPNMVVHRCEEHKVTVTDL